MFCYSRIISNFRVRCPTRKHYSTKKRKYEEVRLNVPWGHISGKWWEPFDTRPILCIHGWQDNCGTFDRLIPMMNPNIGFLTIDLPGHGHSSRLPHGIPYFYKKYILTINSIKNTLKWPKVTLMGHSLGAILSYTFTMYYREDVDFLMCIDGLKPLVDGKNLSRIANNITKFLKYNEHSLDDSEPPAYTLDEMVEKICKPNRNSVMPEYAKWLLERNVAPSVLHEGKYYFTRDPRLKSGDTLDFCQDELLHLAKKLTLPIFISKANASSYYEIKQQFYDIVEVLQKSSTDCNFNYIEGTHHCHLNTPENIAPLLNAFIKKHGVQDRTIGGMTEDIVVEKKKPVVLFGDS